MQQKSYLALAAGFALTLGTNVALADGHGQAMEKKDAMMEDLAEEEDEREYNRKYISLMGSYVATDDDRDVDNTWGGDLRLGKELSEFWNIELSGAIYDEMTVVDAGQSSESSHEEWSLGLNALYFFIRGDHWQPYVAGSAGWARARLATDAIGDERSDFPYLGLALGSMIPLADNGFAARLDVQYRWDLVESGSDNNNSGAENFGDWIINLGVVVPFGKRCCHHNHCGVVEQAAPAIVVVPEDPTLPTFTIKDVHFAHDSSELRPSATVILDEVVAVMQANGGVNALVEGHTSSPGTEEYNLSLSQQRAEIVRDYLVNNGVENDRLRTEAWGESRPIASNDTEEGQAENRRSEIRLESAQQ